MKIEQYISDKLSEILLKRKPVGTPVTLVIELSDRVTRVVARRKNAVIGSVFLGPGSRELRLC